MEINAMGGGDKLDIQLIKEELRRLEEQGKDVKELREFILGGKGDITEEIRFEDPELVAYCAFD